MLAMLFIHASSSSSSSFWPSSAASLLVKWCATTVAGWLRHDALPKNASMEATTVGFGLTARSGSGGGDRGVDRRVLLEEEEEEEEMPREVGKNEEEAGGCTFSK